MFPTTKRTAFIAGVAASIVVVSAMIVGLVIIFSNQGELKSAATKMVIDHENGSIKGLVSNDDLAIARSGVHQIHQSNTIRRKQAATLAASMWGLVSVFMIVLVNLFSSSVKEVVSKSVAVVLMAPFLRLPATFAAVVTCVVVEAISRQNQEEDRAATTFHSFLIRRSIIAAVLLVMLSLLLFFPLRTHQVWDVDNARSIHEIELPVMARVLAMLFGIDGLAQRLGISAPMTWISHTCGSRFSQKLVSDQDRYAQIQARFVEPFDIDMSVYKLKSYKDYDSVNAWFSREIDPVHRPVSSETSIVSPADSRTVVLPDVGVDTSLWLKSQRFTVAELLAGAKRSSELDNGAVVIHRLAVQDYHRFHSPVAGKIIAQVFAAGPLWSTNEMSMRAGNGAIYNQRTIIMIEDSLTGLPVAYVPIGATCVGSVVLRHSVGDTIEKGEDLGYFQFGGSTVVVVFPRDAVLFHPILLESSKNTVEALIKQGSPLAEWKQLLD